MFEKVTRILGVFLTPRDTLRETDSESISGTDRGRMSILVFKELMLELKLIPIPYRCWN